MQVKSRIRLFVWSFVAVLTVCVLVVVVRLTHEPEPTNFLSDPPVELESVVLE